MHASLIGPLLPPKKVSRASSDISVRGKAINIVGTVFIYRGSISNGDPLVIGGDGCADNPGHSAKYGSYGIIDLVTNKVIHLELAQVYQLT